MKTPKQNAKEAFWQEHIRRWLNSGQTRADYCGLNGLSSSSFSKWQKKLRPKLKTGAKRPRPKSRYSKHTKLNDAQYGALIDAFFTTLPVKEVHTTTGISTKTIAKTFEDLTRATVEAALHYPHLFFGAGTLLLLCPPPDCHTRMLQYKADFPHRGYRYRDESTAKGRLRNNIEFVFRLLISYTGYEWRAAETFVFREWGLELFYRNAYAAQQGIAPEAWSLELYYQLASDINLVKALIANMDHWAVHLHQQSPLSHARWDKIFDGRTERPYAAQWRAQMAHDLKWVLNHQVIGGPAKQRNTYWDEFAPSEQDVHQVKTALGV